MNLQSEIRPELWNTISKHYESSVYSSAILEAIHYLSSALRERANIDGDGVSLVGQALGGDNPPLRINKFQTESEKNEQRGIEQLLRGLFQGIRNPRSHEKYDDTKETADVFIIFIDFLLGIINTAKEPFRLAEWKERVFEENFVASDKYAKLMSSEVPPNKYNDALITIYRDKMSGDGEKLKLMVRSLIDLIGEDHLDDFITVVSDELKTIKNTNVIIRILQIIPENIWPRINEISRLRIENMLIKSIEEGRIDTKKPYKETGELGTWAQGYIKYFLSKKELRIIFVRKLQRHYEEQKYLAKYFLQELPNTIDESSSVKENNSIKARFIRIIVRAVSDPSCPSELLENICILPIEWRDQIIKDLKPLKESNPELYERLVKIAE
jgi:uncharacterized protein (TIGR02391 family)